MILKRLAKFGNFYEDASQFINGNITIISLDNVYNKFSNKIRPHIHQNIYQIFILEKGEGSFTLNHEKRFTKHRTILIIPYNVIHGFNFNEDIKGIVISINIDYLNFVLSNIPELLQFYSTPTYFEDIPEISFVKINHLAENIFNELNNKKLFSDKIITSLLELLLLYIYRDLSTNKSAIEIKHLKMVRLFNNFKELLNNNKDKINNLGFFAKKLNITLNKLNNVCKIVAGKSAAQIIDEQVLCDAKSLLIYSDLSIYEISQKLNFTTQNYFTRFFKKHTELTPTEFRNQSIIAPTKK